MHPKKEKKTSSTNFCVSQKAPKGSNKKGKTKKTKKQKKKNRIIVQARIDENILLLERPKKKPANKGMM
jgi:hypothetical protein